MNEVNDNVKGVPGFIFVWSFVVTSVIGTMLTHNLLVPLLQAESPSEPTPISVYVMTIVMIGSINFLLYRIHSCRGSNDE